MVLSGETARRKKVKNVSERSSRSLYVSFKNKKNLDRAKVVEILESVHDGVERVFLPRQKIPRFVYVLCKGTTERSAVQKVFKNLKNDDLGTLFSQIPKPKKTVPAKANKLRTKRVMDPKTLLLEWLPAELSTEDLQKVFPNAENLNRFNPRRCYIKFKSEKDAIKARTKVFKGALELGPNVTVTFHTEEEETDQPSGADREPL